MEGYSESQESKLSKILIIGATGYLGKFMVKASVSMGNPTFAYVRPLLTPPKLHFFHSMGVTLFQVRRFPCFDLYVCMYSLFHVVNHMRVRTCRVNSTSTTSWCLSFNKSTLSSLHSQCPSISSSSRLSEP